MGADFKSYTFKGTEQALLSEFKSRQLDDAAELGNSYSGGFNMVDLLTVENKVFKTRDQAYEYIAKTATKWHNAVAVKVAESIKYNNSAQKALDKNTKKLSDLRKEYELKKQDIRIKAKNKAFVSCSGCKSKISTNHLDGMYCPVCNEENYFLNKSQVNSLFKHIEKIRQTEALQNEIFKKLMDTAKPSTNTVWYVGAWCAC